MLDPKCFLVAEKHLLYYILNEFAIVHSCRLVGIVFLGIIRRQWIACMYETTDKDADMKCEVIILDELLDFLFVAVDRLRCTCIIKLIKCGYHRDSSSL
jgi:hypothetical protein